MDGVDLRVGSGEVIGPVGESGCGKTTLRGSWSASTAPRAAKGVGLDPPLAERHPHTLSGGQLQRAAIARALAPGPDILVCDEPVASMDVSVRAQVLNLFLDPRRDRGIGVLFVSHDLGVVRASRTGWR